MDILRRISYFIINVHCVYSLKSPHLGDSNEYTQHNLSYTEDRKDIPEFYPFVS